MVLFLAKPPDPGAIHFYGLLCETRGMIVMGLFYIPLAAPKIVAHLAVMSPRYVVVVFPQVSQMSEEHSRKESKWQASLSRLQEQVKYLERENGHLHEENHRLKLRGVNAKVNKRTSRPPRQQTFWVSPK